jgi:hypothetical protein
MPTLATIGTSSRKGDYVIVDTALPHSQLMRVTVREETGGDFRLLDRKDLRAMRDLARRAVPGKTLSCRRLRIYRTTANHLQVVFEFILDTPHQGEWGNRPLGPKS